MSGPGLLAGVRTITLLERWLSAMSRRLQKGLFSASSKSSGPSARLRTPVTDGIAAIRSVRRLSRSMYAVDEMSGAETLRMSWLPEGKRRSIAFDS
ncbi:MAG: hypothetical protein DMF87_15600 [Acidobacteria bacterium]|nr:MAG: hypothetical protein DMF87_15600 [Acidobacteriota bacterium]